MTDSREHFALDWIKRELDETLSGARLALEEFAESKDATKMRSCLTNLHQVHGTLIMLELSGVATLSDEMEQLAQAMLGNDVTDVDAGLQLLMQAILELPVYLEQVQKGAPDSRRKVLPIANALRLARGAEAFADAGSAGVDLQTAPGDDALHRYDQIEGHEKVRKIRSAYQQVLLSVLRGEDRAQAVVTLSKVAIGLERICEGTPMAATWRAFGVFVQSLDGDGSNLTGESVRLLRRVDAEIKSLVDGGSEALKEPASLDLMRQLLRAAQERGLDSEELDVLAEAVDEAATGGGPIGPGDQARHTAAAALREELAGVKDQLDLYVRSDARSVEGLSELQAPLKQISSTLAILGFESSKSIIADQIALLQQGIEMGVPDDGALMAIASALVQVDENLAGMALNRRTAFAPASETSAIIGDAQIAVLQEARNGLEQVKQGVVDYVSAGWDLKQIEDVPAVLGAVKGALAMVPLERPAELLGRCAQYVSARLLVDDAPDWTALDTFADAVSGIDYYLERLCEEASLPSEDILLLVERSLDALGRGEPGPASHAAMEFGAEAGVGFSDEGEVPIDVKPPGVAVAAATEVVEAEPEEVETSDADIVPEAPAADARSEDGVELVVDPDEDDAAPEPVTIDDVEDAAFDLGDSLFDEVVGEADAPEQLPDEVAPADDEVLPASDEIDRDDEKTLADEFVLEEIMESAAAEPATAETPAAALIDDDDDEIIEIFVEEVGEVLESIEEWLPKWAADHSQEEALGETRRAFHTLKGSGRIVGAVLIGELAWSVENMLNRVLDGTVEAHAEIAQVATEASQAIPALRDAFRARETADESDAQQIIERAERLATGARLQPADGPADRVAEESAPTAPDVVIADTAAPVEIGETSIVDEEPVGDEEAVAGVFAERGDAGAFSVEETDLSEIATQDDAETYALFEREALRYLEILEAHFATDATSAPMDEDVLRAFHTLKGSSAMADVDAVSRIATPLYEVVSAGQEQGQLQDPDVFDFAQQGVYALRRTMDALAAGATPDEELDLFEAEAQRLVGAMSGTPGVASTLLNLEGAGALMDAGMFLAGWHEGAMNLGTLSDLVAALHEVRNAAQSQNQDAITDLSDALIGAYERLEHEHLDEQSFGALNQAHEALLSAFDAIAAEQAPPDLDGEIAALAALGAEAPAEPPTLKPAEPPVPLTEASDADAADAAEVIEFPKFPSAEEREVVPAGGSPAAETDAASADLGDAAASESVALADETLLPDDVDHEILEIFFEEADELLEAIDQGCQDWMGEQDNRVHLETLLRALHTLKGGARLAGLAALGDQTHAFESFLVARQNEETLEPGFFDALQLRHDEIVGSIGRLKQAALGQGEPAREEPAAPETAAPEAAPEPAERVKVSVEAPAMVPPPQSTQPTEEPSISVAEAGKTESPAARSAKEPREMVRVAASLLEQLVNVAGESSILRSRIEQGMSDFGIALEEMETTIERVREQLRRLEIETEAQVLFRHELGVGAAYEDFDPLEMDRYSQLQQLSRGLSESASDMLDLKETLAFKSREAETLLIQQARLNTELQEGLMRTRMVPFSRLLPRLRRIVRQVARDLDKEVEFHAYNAEGELDRNVLERMVPALEHMLRNAVDHGIETAQERRNFGKPDGGRIDLRLSREAGDVVIEISDDGAGIDVETVRDKAIQQELMADDANLGDEEILQFVLAPGFSTAQAVTQISGRGVGMDVVHSAVKQLGGSIHIMSLPGKGTRFTVRLPFTVSVNRALMVSVGDDLYAVPLNTIEGIVRISKDELEAMYAPDATGFEYAGIPYRVRYLGSYIGREYVARPDQNTVPVVLVRSGDRAMAIHVDAVQGSREIVVKSLGPQFAGVGGISGATILGDGSVVVILDLLALIRARSVSGAVAVPAHVEERDRPACVLVVDDSVTVRKVTSRLLERQGMDIMVAKDGVEAMALLLERRPDVMLLDIEMPRMDGFEVARQVRHDERLSGLPIVMITSRTGTKHQERATELGVNAFLGKPFQENELLATIDELVQRG